MSMIVFGSYSFMSDCETHRLSQWASLSTRFVPDFILHGDYRKEVIAVASPLAAR